MYTVDLAGNRHPFQDTGSAEKLAYERKITSDGTEVLKSLQNRFPGEGDLRGFSFHTKDRRFRVRSDIRSNAS